MSRGFCTAGAATTIELHMLPKAGMACAKFEQHMLVLFCFCKW